MPWLSHGVRNASNRAAASAGQAALLSAGFIRAALPSVCLQA